MLLHSKTITTALLTAPFLLLSQLCAQSKDPGPRPLRFNPTQPPMVTGASASDAALFPAALAAFRQFYSVNGTFVAPAGQFAGVGLGPRFNHLDCGSCHGVPFLGGSSFATTSQAGIGNGQGTDYGVNAPGQQLPPFLKPVGPSIAVRLKYKKDGTRDGGTHPIWTIAGRADAPGCVLPQTDWATEVANNNVAIRITTPTFGAGFIEAIPDNTIVANKTANLAAKNALGIHGHENRSATDGSVSKFGWKGQTSTIRLFTGDAFVNELGVTNTVFVNENDPTPSCQFHPGIEDVPQATPNGPMLRLDLMAHFMRFLAPPTPVAPTASSANGQTLFSTIGCNMCHTPTLNTGASASPALANKPVPLYSDLLVHKMGAGLADDIIQGLAGPDEFRTAPLWGIGQRYYFMHDGRTADLKAAIAAHASPATAQYAASEANAVVTKWNALTETQKQDLLNFLRSL